MSQTVTPTPTPVAAEDRLAARVMEWTRPVIAVMSIVVFGYAFLVAVRTNDQTLIGSFGGVTQSIIMLIVGFYFGSSSSSQKKDKVISDASVALANSTPLRSTVL